MPQNGSIPPPGPLSYEGQVVVPFIMKPFGPQSTFNTFPVPTIWVNTASSNAYILVSKALGNAVWALMGGSPGSLNTITTPDFVIVTPVASNINFLNGPGISITGSGDDITFTATGGGIAWSVVSGTSQAMAVDNGYITNNNALVTLTLPTTAAVGATFEVTGKGNGGWKIVQNNGQQIFFGTVMTSLGVAGSLASTQIRDSVKLVCVTADTEFQVLSSIGDITYV